MNSCLIQQAINDCDFEPLHIENNIMELFKHYIMYNNGDYIKLSKTFVDEQPKYKKKTKCISGLNKH